jgi:hypothetical protein
MKMEIFIKNSELKMELPSELWKYEIYPYLDYDSRLNLNLVLDPETRGYKRINPERIRSHSAHSVYINMRDKIAALVFEDMELDVRILKIKTTFKLFLNPLFQPLFQIKSLREMTLQKCKEFSSASILSPEDREEFIDLEKRLKEKIALFQDNLTLSIPFSVYDKF